MLRYIEATSLKHSVKLVLVLLIAGIVAACSTTDESALSDANQANEPQTEDSAPVVENTTAAPVSPVKTPEEVFESPIPTPVPYRGPDFEINAPVQAGDTVVTGTGPSGITIEIVDVNWGGQSKGTGTISDDGTFSIEVTPIEAGHVIGVMLVDLGNSEYTAADFRNNENYMDIPMIGFLATTYEVPPN